MLSNWILCILQHEQIVKANIWLDYLLHITYKHIYVWHNIKYDHVVALSLITPKGVKGLNFNSYFNILKYIYNIIAKPFIHPTHSNVLKKLIQKQQNTSQIFVILLCSLDWKVGRMVGGSQKKVGGLNSILLLTLALQLHGQMNMYRVLYMYEFS